MANIKLKCETCGNEIILDSNESSAICEYCSNPFNIPQNETREALLNLYTRADNAWEHQDFDEALGLYNRILREDDTQAKAHFSAALCRYGITYVTDPGNGRKVPTCNRFNRTSISEDKDFKLALKYAVGETKESYKKTGEAIDKITNNFLKIVDKEEPYDVFICYKRTDGAGGFTEDSVHARKLYYYLKDKGYKVFFAEISLVEIGGDKYEPYIFAALSSAPVMVLIGSSRENIVSTWVRNEWKRFFSLASQGEQKTIIPCLLNMDPYDLPSEFEGQALDVLSYTFFEDVTAIIDKKVAAAKASRPSNEAKSLTERYATPDKVKRVVDELDCEEKEAIQVLVIHQGNINNTIDYISSEEDYKKKLWVCAECGAKNQHDRCHNDKCLLSKTESITLAKVREEVLRKKEYNSEESRRAREQKKRERAARLRRARPAILIASGILAIVLTVFGIIGGIQVNKVNKLVEKIPETIHDYSRFENEIMEAYTAYNDMWGIYQVFVNTEHLDKNMEGFNNYRVDKIKSTLAELTPEYSGDKDALFELLSKYYKQLNSTQSGMLTSDEFGKLETASCVYDIISGINTLLDDVVANYDKLSDLKVKYNSLSEEYQAYVHNWSKLDNIDDYYNLYSNLEFVSADGGWAVRAKSDSADKITGDVVIPATYKGQEVKTIPEKAFAGCTAISSIVVPDTVTQIGWGAFYNCISLKSISVPFVGTSLTAEGENAPFGAIFGTDSYTGSTGVEQHYYNYYTSKTYHIPAQLRSVTITKATQICSYAFENCSMLTEIDLCDSIIAINGSCFKNCKGIKSISLPNVTVIPEDAFLSCASLESFTIEESVTTIGDRAFMGCIALKRINSEEEGTFIIPDTVKQLGFGTFNGCINIKSITLPFIGTSLTAEGINAPFGAVFGTDSYTGSTGVEQHYYNYYTSKTYHVPAQLRSVTITGETQIVYRAFENCSMLTSLKINSAAKQNVGEEAFKNCIKPTYF